MDKGEHYDVQMKRWIEKGHYDVQIVRMQRVGIMWISKGGSKVGIMMCKLKEQRDKRAL